MAPALRAFRNHVITIAPSPTPFVLAVHIPHVHVRTMSGYNMAMSYKRDLLQIESQLHLELREDDAICTTTEFVFSCPVRECRREGTPDPAVVPV